MWHQISFDSVSQDILLQIFDVIHSDVTLQNHIFSESSLAWGKCCTMFSGRLDKISSSFMIKRHAKVPSMQSNGIAGMLIKVTHNKGRILYQAVILFNCVPYQNGLLPEGANSFLYEQFLIVWKITYITLSELPWMLLFILCKCISCIIGATPMQRGKKYITKSVVCWSGDWHFKG